MSSQSKFKGRFVYSTKEDALIALHIIDDEEKNPDDDFEKNAIMRESFTISDDGTVLSLDFSGFMPARSWYGSRRVLCKMSAKAVDGKIRCSFEGDAAEFVVAGRGWS